MCANEEPDREIVEAQRAIQEVQIEGGDAEPEASEGRGAEVQERVASAERSGYCGWPSVTSTVCSFPSRRIVSFTLSPGRNLTITLCSGCSASIAWSLTFVTMSFTRIPACCPGEPGTTCVTTMPVVPEGRPSCAAWRGQVPAAAPAVALRVARDEGVHADDLVRRDPDERTARVSFVDRRIGLDQILEEHLRRLGDATPFR